MSCENVIKFLTKTSWAYVCITYMSSNIKPSTYTLFALAQNDIDTVIRGLPQPILLVLATTAHEQIRYAPEVYLKVCPTCLAYQPSTKPMPWTDGHRCIIHEGRAPTLHVRYPLRVLPIDPPECIRSVRSSMSIHGMLTLLPRELIQELHMYLYHSLVGRL